MLFLPYATFIVILRFKYRKSLVRKLNRHNSVHKNFNVKLLWKRTLFFMRVVYASRLYFIQTIKKNSISDISISLCCLQFITKSKKVLINFSINMNKRLTKSGIWMFLKKYLEFRKYPENLHPCTAMKQCNTI